MVNPRHFLKKVQVAGMPLWLYLLCLALTLGCMYAGVIPQKMIPALLVLTPLLGFPGVQLAQPVSDILTFCIALVLQLRFLRELKAGPAPENP